MITAVLASLALAGPAHAAEIGVSAKGHATNPVWSDSGDHLAFEMNDFGGRIDLFVAKMSSGSPMGAPTQIKLPGASSSFGGGGSIVTAPTWHSDGILIFEGSSPGGTSRLFFWQPGGASASELLSSSQISGDLSWPAVSRDGAQVAFISGATGSGDLYIWNRNSNEVSQALTSPFTEAAPRWSADGKLAYTRKNRGTEDVFTFVGGKSIPLVGGNGDQSRPIWAGDTVLYFSSERGDGIWDIVATAGPGQKKTIARDVRLPIRAAPAITPDGQWVAYAFADPEQGDRIGFVKVDGSSPTTVRTGLVASGEPSVMEVGGRWMLAFTALPGEGADWRKLHVIDITGQL
ncbi:MAG: PD40 domain-containing protein [Alphaproteobacteria bacterium]|nr:PD40 domain-containing protein [Alphaproteobacteria bacterium]